MTTTEETAEPVLAMVVLADGGDEEYWWSGDPGKRGAVVFKTDRFGQRWTLDIESTHWVTQRVAAGLLCVTPMTVNNWVRTGKIRQARKRKVSGDLSFEGRKIVSEKGRGSVSVIPLKEIEKLAEARGMFLRTPLTPEKLRAMRSASFKRKKGGDSDANKG